MNEMFTHKKAIKSDTVKQFVVDSFDECIFLDKQFDEALLGYVESFEKTVPLYDKDICINILMDDGMTWEEAVEYYDYNIVSAYHGEGTPSYATVMKSNKKEEFTHKTKNNKNVVEVIKIFD